jgi:D-arginine dehydrogenase
MEFIPRSLHGEYVAAAMATLEVCIIGGGMAGTSVAYHLAPHARVTLLEREPHPAYHSSGRSAALFAPTYGSSLTQRLTLAGQSFLAGPPQGFASTPLLRERGFLLLGHEAQLAERDEYERVASEVGLRAKRLSPLEAREVLPVLRPEACDWALLDPAAWDIDVDALLQGFLRGARTHGARVFTSRAVTALVRTGAGWIVRGPEFELPADVIVNAAGAWADEVATLAGLAPLRLVPHRRTAFIFDPPENCDVAGWPMVADAASQYYFKPDAGRLLGSLAEEAPAPAGDAHAEDLDVAVAVDRIEHVVDFPIRRVLRSWAGLRVFGPDRDPVSGFERGEAGFYWHAGLGGYGIETSPALGAFAAAAILGHPPPTALAERGVHAGELAPQRLR